MKKGKIVIAGIVVTIVNAIVSMVTCGGIFNWVYKLEPTNVWKPMATGPGPLFFAAVLILNIILALVYAVLHKGIPGKNPCVKGLLFGLCVWAVGMLPGMLSTYVFMTVAPSVIIYWTLMGLVESPLFGVIIAAIYGE